MINCWVNDTREVEEFQKANLQKSLNELLDDFF